MNCNKNCLFYLVKKSYSTVASKGNDVITETENKATSLKKSHSIRLSAFFRNNPHIQKIKQYIPEKYLNLKRLTAPDNVYLIDSNIAKTIVTQVVEELKKNKTQVICETNAGLGFISAELLDNGIEKVRLYESCPEFNPTLKDFNNVYPGRVELFAKDIFLMHRYNFLDKQDHGNRIEQLLHSVPKKSWIDSPVLTVFGTMGKLSFIQYLMKSLVLQNDVVTYGRIQLYVLMRPADYIILTAGPHLNLHTYQSWSVLFNLFFDFKLLNKFPRNAFLPWEELSMKRIRYSKQIDSNLMYFVSIQYKKKLPVATKNLLALFSFVRQFFGKGTVRIVPTLEKWVPGSGLNVIIPQHSHKNYFKHMNVYSKFGELTPDQILYVFDEMINHPEYNASPFKAMIEAQLLRNETIDSSLDEHLEKNIVNDIKVKLDIQ